MVWSHPINDSFWINLLTVTLIACWWIVQWALGAIALVLVAQAAQVLFKNLDHLFAAADNFKRAVR